LNSFQDCYRSPVQGASLDVLALITICICEDLQILNDPFKLRNFDPSYHLAFPKAAAPHRACRNEATFEWLLPSPENQVEDPNAAEHKNDRPQKPNCEVDPGPLMIIHVVSPSG
jgi:hypothetical protein